VFNVVFRPSGASSERQKVRKKEREDLQIEHEEWEMKLQAQRKEFEQVKSVIRVF
jgi:hypothetical protein